MAEFVRVAELEALPEGRVRVFRVRGRGVALLHAAGAVYAVKDTCPHLGVSLEGGAVSAGILTCPGHGWQFDLATGDALDHPSSGLRCYRAEVREGIVWVEIP